MAKNEQRLVRRLKWRLLGAAGVLACLASGAPAKLPGSAPVAPRTDARPNLLVIMADDVGYSDLGAFGGEIDTPNLDALAAHALRFSNFQNMSRCCPSRASLLTGRYPHKVGMAGNGTSLSRNVPTVAETLRAAGYATSMVGKWHLTAATPLADPAEQLKWLNHQAYRSRDFGDTSTYPTARGFDRFWGIVWGVADYYDPFSLVDGTTPVPSVPRGFYLTDAISDHAAAEVARLGTGKQPYLLYLAYTAAHWPLMALDAVIRKYLPRYRAGWETIRAARYARQVKGGLIDPRTAPLPALDTGYANNASIAWDRLTPAQRDIQVRKMATHAAMVDIMDQGIGRVITALKASRQYDNTVVLFLNDNGASPEIMVQPGYDRPSETRDGRPIAYGEYPVGIGGEQTMAGIGDLWAGAANTPWRYWKAESYQGGTHTPFLLSWPGHLGAREGTVVADAAHVIDVTPTLLELAHVAADRTTDVPIDGISLLPALQGRPVGRGRLLYTEHYGARAVSDGRWKLVSLAPGGRRADLPWSLYDLSVDRTETRNIARAHPDIVARLDTAWAAWAKRVGVPLRAPQTQAAPSATPRAID
uniref:arylsulfatase n=1 Tax=uncultured Sphingomonas sp. TaxID=158754 RepID=UPI0035CC3D93